MKRILKKFSLIALSVAIGTTGVSFAQNTQINAVKDNAHQIFLDDEKSDTDLINYQGRLYAPIRFFSEKMGLSVDYNNAYKTVRIKNNNIDNLNAQIQELEKQKKETETKLEAAEKKIKKLQSELLSKKDNSTGLSYASAVKLNTDDVEKARNEDIVIGDMSYKKIPIYFSDDTVSYELSQIVKTDAEENSSFYINIKNKSYNPIMIDAFSARFSYIDRSGGFTEIALDNVRVGEQDIRVLSSFEPYFEGRFYLTLDEIPENVHEGVLTFNFYEIVNYERVIKRVNMAVKID